MIFEFITDTTTILTVDIAAKIYNLMLLYFLWDIARYIMRAIKSKIGGSKFD